MADFPLPPPPLASGGVAARTGPVRPFHARRGEFIPEVGGYVIADFNGEKLRCEITYTHSDDVIEARIVSISIGKHGHTFQKDDPVALQRAVDKLGVETWVPINSREVREREAREAAAREVERRIAEARTAAAADSTAAEPAPEDLPDLSG